MLSLENDSKSADSFPSGSNNRLDAAACISAWPTLRPALPCHDREAAAVLATDQAAVLPADYECRIHRVTSAPIVTLLTSVTG